MKAEGVGRLRAGMVAFIRRGERTHCAMTYRREDSAGTALLALSARWSPCRPDYRMPGAPFSYAEKSRGFLPMFAGQPQRFHGLHHRQRHQRQEDNHSPLNGREHRQAEDIPQEGHKQHQ